MRVRFIGNPARSKDGAPVDNATSCTWHGKTFALGAEVDVSDLPEAFQKKLAGNSHFEVVSGEAEAPKRRGRPPRAEQVSDAQD